MELKTLGMYQSIEYSGQGMKLSLGSHHITKTQVRSTLLLNYPGLHFSFLGLCQYSILQLIYSLTKTEKNIHFQKITVREPVKAVTSKPFNLG